MMRLNAKLKESETRINNLLAQVHTIAPAPANICQPQRVRCHAVDEFQNIRYFIGCELTFPSSSS